jgi:hypothetical protein
LKRLVVVRDGFDSCMVHLTVLVSDCQGASA